jgi:hypothetical protein
MIWSLFVRAADVPIDGGAKGAPDDRRHPEEPQLRDGSPADEHRDAGAARGIHRRVGDGNADQVDEREAQPDGDGGEPCARLSVAPRMMSRNIMVITTS